ncbi:alpha/beta fold hydrolase [Simiduia sp. 21SJ11W-1]|uniref:alpha/beta hydrolase n=1 Tax=Simiduia sp. 21SJ11W-1 TaxID=2909669 RepID=UPI00209E47E9|nr:alpha/beta fold hydrolase [Simiduia sp. 21SJ11W-1]UTA48831.1 alpha/beta fold hydrolase [Simiduia sp. 21SJ11W-1]
MTIFADHAQRHLIAGPAGALEVSTRLGDAAGPLAGLNLVAVIAHPHPLHGGSMSNKVVATLARAYAQLGVATVCFNFRGVGASEGHFDNGEGEQADVLAVAQWAQAARPQAGLLLAGFSFGSAMAAAASWVLSPLQLLLVAPPVERYSYDRAGQFPCATAVLVGSADELVEVGGLTAWSQTVAKLQFDVLPDTGHFFHGQLHAVRGWVQRTLSQWANIAEHGDPLSDE